MKELYIRKGNSEEIKDILIVGEESKLGSRDSAYKIGKGLCYDKFIKKADPYSKSKDLFYIHAVPNIELNETFPRDYDIHEYIKKYCTDILTWDGESDEGRVRSREAFICRNGNAQGTANELYSRVNDLLFGIRVVPASYKRRKFFKWVFLFIPRVLITIITLPFLKPRKGKKFRKKLWKN